MVFEIVQESFLIIIRQKYSIISKNKKGSAEQVSTPNEKYRSSLSFSEK
jgi:hypothetical protein